MVGTVTYMPPEQALGRAPDGRSDLYGLGAMLYEMVTGRPPFLGDDVVAIVSQHINTSPVAPSWHNPEIPRALEALIMRLLAKVPEERPENAAAVRQALAAVSEAARAGQPPLEAQANPLDRLAGGVFVGREREMDELRAGLEEALSAHGRLLMLVGEPGIGKTRTAEELATYARLRKTQVLVGRCYESEGAPAYWPWIQIVRAYIHERDPAALMSELGSGAGEIARIVSAAGCRACPSRRSSSPSSHAFGSSTASRSSSRTRRRTRPSSSSSTTSTGPTSRRSFSCASSLASCEEAGYSYSAPIGMRVAGGSIRSRRPWPS